MSEFILSAARDVQERRGAIRMHPSGLYVRPLDLTPADVNIDDIAHHLSNVCRYTGASPWHYSVAQHSVLVANHFSDPAYKLAALLHDASEAYLNDIASPVKHDPRFAFYREAEAKATAVIFAALGADISLLAAVKPIDDKVFCDEVATFWGGADPQHTGVHRIQIGYAKGMFLNMWKEIQCSIAFSSL